jgi:hypothetical protein
MLGFRVACQTKTTTKAAHHHEHDATGERQFRVKSRAKKRFQTSLL